MKTIPLTQNQFAIVDDEDFEELSSNPDHQSQNHLGFQQRVTELVLSVSAITRKLCRCHCRQHISWSRKLGV
jgi:hypothetical protein